MGTPNKENLTSVARRHRNKQSDKKKPNILSKTPFADYTNNFHNTQLDTQEIGTDIFVSTADCRLLHSSNDQSERNCEEENVNFTKILKVNIPLIPLVQKHIETSNTSEKIRNTQLPKKQLFIKCVLMNKNELKMGSEKCSALTDRSNRILSKIQTNKKTGTDQGNNLKKVNSDQFLEQHNPTPPQLVVNLEKFNMDKYFQTHIPTSAVINSVLPGPGSIEDSKNSKNLRTRNNIKYTEESFRESVINVACDINATDTRKYPVYRNAVKDLECQKEKSDNLYDFNEGDFFGDKHFKKNKTRKKLSMFDKTTHDTLQKIESKELKEMKKQTRKMKKNEDNMNYKKTVENIMQSVANKIQRKENTPVKVQLLENDERNFMVKGIHTKSPRHDSLEMPPSPLYRSEPRSEHLVFENDEDDKYFGFDEQPRVNVLADVLVQSPSTFLSRCPDANSTILNQVPGSTPWRFCVEKLRRNPHFLEIKPSSLPSLMQDPIIDCTLDISVNCADLSESKLTAKQDTPKKNLKQTSITEFIDISQHFHDNRENIKPRSLFDSEEFDISPIKPNNRTLTRNQTKKMALSIINSNIQKELTDDVEKQAVELSKSNFTFFGFDEEDITQENENEMPPNKNRFSVQTKTYVRKSAMEQTTNKISEKIQNIVDIENTNTSNFDINEENDNDLQLFDDPEAIFNEELPSPKLPQKRKRQRRISCQSEEGNVDHKPRKKRKDIMTKSEEERFETWAASFNLMCQEVESHELEIE